MLGSSKRGRRHILSDAICSDDVTPRDPQSKKRHEPTKAGQLPWARAWMLSLIRVPMTGNCSRAELMIRSVAAEFAPRILDANVVSSRSRGNTESMP